MMPEGRLAKQKPPGAEGELPGCEPTEFRVWRCRPTLVVVKPSVFALAHILPGERGVLTSAGVRLGPADIATGGGGIRLKRSIGRAVRHSGPGRSCAVKFG